MVYLFAEVTSFSFWSKTMGYSQAFRPKLRSFFAVILLHSGKCYEAEICGILLFLRWHSMKSFLAKVKYSVSGRKPWTTVHSLNQGSSFFLQPCTHSKLLLQYVLHELLGRVLLLGGHVHVLGIQLVTKREAHQNWHLLLLQPLQPLLG